jgi:DNA-directed RNA polymerase subunit RPC12/RpoP
MPHTNRPRLNEFMTQWRDSTRGDIRCPCCGTLVGSAHPTRTQVRIHPQSGKPAVGVLTATEREEGGHAIACRTCRHVIETRQLP